MKYPIQQHREIEYPLVRIAKRLVYFYILLGFIGGLLFLDFSPDYVDLMIGVAVIYIGLSILIGWLMLNAISRKSRGSYLLPLVVFIISAFLVGYDLYDLPISIDLVIPVLELATLAILFFTARRCYFKLGWEKGNDGEIRKFGS